MLMLLSSGCHFHLHVGEKHYNDDPPKELVFEYQGGDDVGQD